MFTHHHKQRGYYVKQTIIKIYLIKYISHLGYPAAQQV